MRVRHDGTGVVMEVSDKVAENLDVRWKPAPSGRSSSAPKAPSKRAAAKPAADDSK